VSPPFRGSLLLAGLVLLTGCLVPLETRKTTVGRLLRAHESQPVADARLTVTTLSWWEPVDTFTARTDESGGWSVPAKLRLNFLVPVPEGPRYENRYLFEAPAGEKLVLDGLTLSPDRYLKAGDAGPRLRVEVDQQDGQRSFHWLPALGVGFGGGHTFSAHFGAAVLFGDGRRNAGLRAVGEWGGTAVGGALGLVIMPGITSPPLSFEINARYLYQTSQETSELGPEIAVDGLGLRFGLSVLGRSAAGTFWRDGRVVFFGGWGHL
jgi:hypothetical protein